jgi:hypothetical protein
MMNFQTANCRLQIANCKLNNAKNRRIRLAACGFATLCLLLGGCPLVYADANAAANKAREGIAEFQKRDFKAALKDFEEAESIAPDDLRLVFDRGCAYSAQGEAEKAIEQFQKSAAAADKKLAALSNYNMGCLAVARAKTKFGEKPEDAEGEVRAQGLEMIAAAGRHFRDALNLDSQDEEARYNLETLRTWSAYIQKAWKDRDRQRRREKLNLLDYLQFLETEQRGLRAKVKELQSIAQDSPRKRQSIREVENAQRELAEEIGPLKQKIEQLTAGQGRGPGAEAALPADARKAVELLKTIADGIGNSMQAVAERLAENSLPESLEPQTNAIENIDQIFSAVAPYVNLVQKGISRQEELIGLSNSSARPSEEGIKTTSPRPTNLQSVPGEGPGVRAKDRTDAAWNQQFVERYAKIIPLKAKQELKQLESQPAAASTPPPPADSAAGGKEPKTKDAKQEAALKAEEQRREMKEALQLGVELSPKVEQLARESAELLSQEKSAEALPKQQESLKLLKEMLPKQQQQEQQKKEQEKKEQEKKDQQKDQKKKDQEKKDQEKKDQDKKDQQKNQDKKDQEKEKNDQQQKDRDKKNQDKKDQEKKDQQKQEQQKNQQNKEQSDAQPGQKQEMSKEQAEELLRRAHARQEEHKELQKEIEGYLYRPERVEKDW